MGYSMYMLKSSFFMAQEYKLKALQAVKDVANQKASQEDVLSSFAFIETSDLLKASSLEEALRRWRWLSEADADGNIVSIEFVGEKLGDDEVLFSAVAPYVQEDSYVQMVGEDGTVWRWFFHENTVRKDIGRIVFEE